MKLYSFFNSSASYRVRIALALKGIDYQTVGVNIRIGQQNALAYRRMNPVGWCRRWSLMTANRWGNRWPSSTGWTDIFRKRRCCRRATRRSRALEIVYAIACDIHPINNMRVLRYLTDELKVSEEDKNAGTPTGYSKG